MANVAILGAGLTGLALSYKLSKDGEKVRVFEKESVSGGLARSFKYKNYVFDIGPHIFRTNSEELLSFIRSFVNTASVKSDPKIWRSQGILYDPVTPIITHRNLFLLPKCLRERALKEFAKAKISSDKLENLDNFENCIKAQIGETLYEQFFKGYSEKWWGISPRQLSADIAPKNLTLSHKEYYGHISASFQKPKEEIYPNRNGIGEIAKNLSARIKSNKAEIITGVNIVDSTTDGNKVKSVVAKVDGVENEYLCDRIISTIPLTEITSILNITCKLTYRSLILVFLEVNKKRVLRNTWLYFPDKDIIFGRMSEPKMFSKLNSPHSKTSLCSEIACQMTDRVWTDRSVGNKVIEEINDLGIAKKNEMQILKVQRITHAYPIFSLQYKKHLTQIEKRLSDINVQIAGRTGSFQLLNMDGCIAYAQQK